MLLKPNGAPVFENFKDTEDTYYSEDKPQQQERIVKAHNFRLNE